MSDYNYFTIGDTILLQQCNKKGFFFVRPGASISYIINRKLVFTLFGKTYRGFCIINSDECLKSCRFVLFEKKNLLLEL